MTSVGVIPLKKIDTNFNKNLFLEGKCFFEYKEFFKNSCKTRDSTHGMLERSGDFSTSTLIKFTFISAQILLWGVKMLAQIGNQNFGCQNIIAKLSYSKTIFHHCGEKILFFTTLSEHWQLSEESNYFLHWIVNSFSWSLCLHLFFVFFSVVNNKFSYHVLMKNDLFTSGKNRKFRPGRYYANNAPVEISYFVPSVNKMLLSHFY